MSRKIATSAPKQFSPSGESLVHTNERLFNPALAKVLRRFFSRFYREHGRRFPWRESEVTPFGIFVLEMLLVQTRAESVVSVWIEVIGRWPTPASLAAADPDELLRLVGQLGLGNRRQKALRTAAAAIVQRYKGHVPRSVERLAALPHVGLYTSRAVACFGFGQRVPIVDANVLRVYGRLTGRVYDDDNRRWPEVWALAEASMPAQGARAHNWGLLDFAATICTSRSPKCVECPLLRYCHYGTLLLGIAPPALQEVKALSKSNQ